jgi:hypothetical protein
MNKRILKLSGVGMVTMGVAVALPVVLTSCDYEHTITMYNAGQKDTSVCEAVVT